MLTKTRVVRVIVHRDAADLEMRQAECLRFRAEVIGLGLTGRKLARLLGHSYQTVYGWMSRGKSCVPPPLYAKRFVWLLRQRPDIKDLLAWCPHKSELNCGKKDIRSGKTRTKARRA